jgi:D-methionine transport system permease protein
MVQAAVVMGASVFQMIVKVYLPEALPGLSVLYVLAITMINFSAMAGAMGGGDAENRVW